jgi:uncharacterized protein (DUF433 family)
MAMILGSFQSGVPALTPPVRLDESGLLRVARTRVTLYTVVRAFWAGESAEQIQESFSTLSLADVYGAIAFYLQNRAELDAYFSEQEKAADEFREEWEKDHPSDGTRARLLARRAAAPSEIPPSSIPTDTPVSPS